MHSTRKPPTVALFGNFGSDNFGNEGSFQAMVEFLRRERPEAHLFCVCADPSVVRREFGVAAVPMRRSVELRGAARTINRILLRIPGKMYDLTGAFRTIRSADVMIIPGTGILDDFGERPQGMPLVIFMWCLAARLAGTKIAFVSIGAGPIRHRISRWLMVSAARLANYRSYRDGISRDFMRDAGVAVREDAVCPDIAFNLSIPPERSRAVSGPETLTVGVGVMKYRGWYGFADGGQAIFDSYIDKLARFVTYVVQGGHRVKLLMGEAGDMEAVDALVARLQSAEGHTLEHVSSEPSRSLHDLMEQISETDVVVATRFHNIVCALKMGKPAISLGYSMKNDVLLAEAGLGEYCQHVDTFNVDALSAQFEEVVARKQELERAVRACNLAFKRQLTLQNERLLEDLLPDRRSELMVLPLKELGIDVEAKTCRYEARH